MEVLGEGSVVQREPGKPRGKCRKWELSVKVAEGGRTRRKTRAFHGSYKEAKAALADFAAELGDAPPPSGWLFEDYAWRWHGRRKGAIAPKTEAAEASRIRAICEVIGQSKLEDVGRDEISAMVAGWMETHKPSTVNLRIITAGQVFKTAVSDGLIASNPVEGIHVPRKTARVRKVLDNAQMDTLASALDPSDPWQLAVMLCLGCGLRCDEAAALEWGDWDGESIHVERAGDGRGGYKEPKTPAGVRTVPAPGWLTEALDSWGRDSGPMFPFTGYSLVSWWLNHRESFGVDCTLHELRHSYLTRLARAGVHPRVMMQLAGHESIKVCMEIYAHVTEDMERDAVRAAWG